jgi:hypothetical protein
MSEAPIVRASCRLWSAWMLALSVASLESILRCLPVIAGNLDPVVLRHALRGGQLPDPDTYIAVTDAMLDAISEAEPVLTRQAGRP